MTERPDCAEAICLLPTFTEVNANTPNSFSCDRDKRYAVIVNNPKHSTLSGGNPQEKVRYVEIRTPDRRGVQSQRGPMTRSQQRVGGQPCVSWTEPEYHTCYLDSPETQAQHVTTGTGPGRGFNSASKPQSPVLMDVDQGYAQLGKTDAVPYDNLVHRDNQLNELYTDFQNSVI